MAVQPSDLRSRGGSIRSLLDGIIEVIKRDSAIWPRWSVHKNGTDQGSVGTATEIVTWSTAEFDKGANIDLASTFDFTVPTGADGIYDINAALMFDSADQDTLILDIMINRGAGNVLGRRSIGRASGVGLGGKQVQGKFDLIAGDKVLIFAADNTVADTISGQTYETYFEGARIA